MNSSTASLAFSNLFEQKTIVPSEKQPNIIIEDFGTEVFYDKPRLEDCEKRPCPVRLEQVGRLLSELTDMATLYPEVCRLLAQEPKSAAAVFRLSEATSSCLEAPDIVACHFGTHPKRYGNMAEKGTS